MPTILLVIEVPDGQLQILVDPNWRKIVQTEDLEYLESLLRDFLERAREEPEALFQQISFLDVGPLVTGETGEDIAHHPSLLELSSRFRIVRI